MPRKVHAEPKVAEMNKLKRWYHKWIWSTQESYHGAKLEIAWWWVRHGWKLLVCRMRGHKIVDHSYGGPDTGCVDVECTRCGQNWYTRLY